MADQKINGALYRSMVIEGALAIAEKKEQANELNVFPVPDGDTGTNMSMTMGSAMAEMEKLAEPTLAKAADATASALLRGARGNSGVILSLLFRGMAKKLRETDEADGRTLALALREGVDTAYKAVMKPAEGTILTVSRVAAQHAVELCQAEPTLTAEQVLAAIIEQGHTALEETVHQNPVLEKAGVVDAGGFGFITIFDGMLDRCAASTRNVLLRQSRPSPPQTSLRSTTRTSPSPTAPSSSHPARIRHEMLLVCAPF